MICWILKSEMAGKFKNLWKSLVNKYRRWKGPVTKTITIPESSGFPTKERKKGKDRAGRWETRPALWKWQNIPVRATNTRISMSVRIDRRNHDSIMSNASTYFSKCFVGDARSLRERGNTP